MAACRSLATLVHGSSGRIRAFVFAMIAQGSYQAISPNKKQGQIFKIIQEPRDSDRHFSSQVLSQIPLKCLSASLGTSKPLNIWPVMNIAVDNDSQPFLYQHNFSILTLPYLTRTSLLPLKLVILKGQSAHNPYVENLCCR